jgi:myo-inositol-1-phosphate synthase
MPADLKRDLAREATATGGNLNDLAVGILASRFAVPFESSGRKSGRPSEKGDVLLRMPLELKDKLTRRARERKRTVNQLIVETLSERLGAHRKEKMASSNGSKTGRAHGNGKVRVAIIGVGNCANSLLQGVEYYKDADPAGTVPGLMHVAFGDYHVSDVEFVAAFDVDDKKVGKDLSEAINASENNTIKIAEVPTLGIEVQRGPTLDGLGKYYRETIEESGADPVDVVRVLKETEADVMVSYLPVGSEEADKFYAQCAIDAGVAFVNALPVFIASDPEWARKFEDAGVPIVGDDIKSQVGATITHRVLAKLFEDRGVVLDRTFQLNVGGNMDFKNMLERERLESKKISKTQAVTSNLTHDLGARNVHIGPSDYVQWLDDRKWAYVRLEGRAFGDVPLNMEYKLEVWDSPNSAGIIIDAIRAAKIALDRGIGGPLLAASSYLMKSPPVQRPDDQGRASVEAFIRGDVER